MLGDQFKHAVEYARNALDGERPPSLELSGRFIEEGPPCNAAFAAH
jgi:hypothetical protein